MPGQDDPDRPAPPPDAAPTRAGEGSATSFGLNEALLRKLRIRVPGYELLDVIGRGGQATVYKAIEQTESRTPVAIKILHSGPLADPAARERLRREARAMRALLGSPNIVSAFADGQTEEGHDYLIMNFVDGKPLDEFWKHRRPGTHDAEGSPAQLALFKKICDAVALAHRRGITHRDLSPSNILVDDQAEPHILDFGLAHTAFDQLHSPDVQSISVTGQFVGKLAYASPEQASGVSAAIDVRTDVYALGIILYQILTGGRFPYQVVGTLLEVMNNIVHVTPVRPSEALEAAWAQEIQSGRTLRKTHPSHINRTVEQIVLKALEKKPEDRYQTAGELAAEIGRYLAGQPTLVSLAPENPAGDRPGPRQLTGRFARYVAVAILLTLTIAAALLASLFRSGKSADAVRLAPAASASPSRSTATGPVQQTTEDPQVPVELQRKMARMPPVYMTGHWHVESNSVVRDEEPDLVGDILYFGDPAWTDYDFRATVSLTLYDKTTFAIDAHVVDLDNYWRLAMGAYGPGNLDLFASVTGEDAPTSASRRWMPGEFESTVGRSYLMEMKVSGGHVTAFLDGQRKCTSFNAKLTHGRVGLVSWRAVRVDNITVTAPDGTLLWKGPPILAGAPAPGPVSGPTSAPGAGSR